MTSNPLPNKPASAARRILGTLGRFAGTLIFGILMGAAAAALVSNSGDPQPVEPAAEGAPELWTCSMHPQVQRPAPGICPICEMDLIPLEAGQEAAPEEARIQLTASAVARARIETAPAHRAYAEVERRFFGRVDLDETRHKTITAWIPGRIDRLYVDYTGLAVREGDHLVELFSPRLIQAQEELLQARRALAQAPKDDLIAQTLRETLGASRDKLRLLGLSAEQIAEIEASGAPRDRLTIYAPSGGIVVHKSAMEGMYVETGTKLFEIADLSLVWVILEAYESDLPWLRYGQSVRFEAEAWPGEAFEGRIAFIAPTLDTRTRTVRVRVNVPNPEGKLKPGMFVRATLEARMAEGGVVPEESLEGKWISPMHPEIIKDAPGDCDVCGMPLVRAESLGVTAEVASSGPPLLIPATAPLYAGERAIVYVEDASAEMPTYTGRVVELGPRAGAWVIVRSGLEAGERVVVEGAFKVDSALQIQARPSMMSAPEDAAHEHLSDLLRRRLRPGFAPVVEAAVALQSALARDELSGARAAAEELASAALALRRASADAPETWSEALAELNRGARQVAAAQALEAARRGLQVASQGLAAALDLAGNPGAAGLTQVRCPMAFNNAGAAWVQTEGPVANPYFGASMLRCGAREASWEAASTPARESSKPPSQAASKPTSRPASRPAAQPSPPPVPPEAVASPSVAWQRALALQAALAEDDGAAARVAARALAVGAPEAIAETARAVAEAEDIDAARTDFKALSEALIAELEARGNDSGEALIEVRCSMATSGGARWIQAPGEVANPYFGASMLRCGEVKRRWSAKGGE